MRRMDYSSFNVLPKQKINSYHIKMEDECSIGNDETRIFILSNLASNKMNKAHVFCANSQTTQQNMRTSNFFYDQAQFL